MVKGVFSKKSKFRYTLFSPLALLEVTFDLRNSNILFLKDAHLYHHFSRIPFDVVRNTLLMFYNELIYKTVYQFHEDVALFRYAEESVLRLDAEEVSTSDIHLSFMIGLLKVLGVGIVNNHSEENSCFSIQESCFQPYYFEDEDYLSKEASLYLSELLKNHENETNRNLIEKSIRMELLHFLIRYLTFHIPGFKMSDSLRILTEILN